VVAECFGLSGLKGHRTGGSIHFVINNQIGFTTSPRYSRSSPYCSDVARMIEAPILHVNGDDPEAVVHCAKIAIEYRQRFQKPVVIDMFCYRRFGHNESDEPMFTQPLMYKKIKAHPTVVEIYGRRLVEEGVIADGEVDSMRATFRARLDEDTLKAIADRTRGEYFHAGTATDLQKIYQNLSARLVFEKQRTEITALFSAVAAGLMLLSAFLSLLWFNRIL